VARRRLGVIIALLFSGLSETSSVAEVDSTVAQSWASHFDIFPVQANAGYHSGNKK
jgi:hypothetical protein